ncbi:MAG: hypothetical protein J6Y28_03240 [Acholeplasmatales bacterium]|nr:hypothetical protein [Acholeplasmatales bacterium]
MNLFLLAIFGVILFMLLTFCRKWYDYAMLFTFAIGFAVNANIYNASSVPVELGKIIFAIDSILYTGFTFTVIICAKEYGVRKAKILTSSAIAAVLLSSVIELFATTSSFGYSSELLKTFFGYIASAIGTFIGIWVMLYIFEKLMNKNVNVYLSFFICVLISSIINSTIYYGYSLIVYQKLDAFIYILLGSYIGKFYAIILGLLSYAINKHLWIPNDLKKDEEVEEI